MCIVKKPYPYFSKEITQKLLLFFGLIIPCIGFTQILEPIKWKTEVEKIGQNEYWLISKAEIEDGWHLYSQFVPDDGPLGTTFKYYNEESKFKILGKTTEEEGQTVYDSIFEMKIKYFENSAVFKQKIQLYEDISSLNGIVDFMACDDAHCLAPTEIDLVFDFLKNSSNTAVRKLPESQKIKPIENYKQKHKGLWSIFIISFLAGFAALLTPCVFPMIPLTVSFFTKQNKNRVSGLKNALIYALCIVLIYVLLGTAVTGLFGASALNALATNVYLNIIFFLILVVFSFSFLGAYEIELPRSWANRIDSQSNRKGGIGIFFMALALVIVSFSCTGPIVGALLVEAASNGGLAPIFGMLGFSLALALPFALFAAFPGWLKSIPKSGSWLNTVKVVLGFLELALAFKFLSQADLVLQTHLLEREVFLAIWIAIFGTLTLYLFGKIRTPNDATVINISIGRLCLGIIALAFTIYMIPGLWGAPLKIISAFPPSQNYSESPYGVGFSKVPSSNIIKDTESNIGNGSYLLAPHDIWVFDDYDRGLEYARKIGKPLMLDFTGWACVNCRKMEQNVWSNSDVLKILKNDIVLVSLYVDDKRALPNNVVVNSKIRTGKILKNIGQKWSEFQTIRYNTNSQPFYVLLDHNEENLIDPIAYTPNAEEYLDWLINGVSNFKE